MPRGKKGKKGKGKGKSTGSAAAAASKRTENLQKLSPKLQGVWKSVIHAYESKAYKKALKLADSILKVVPQHGETLAMKGIITKFMGPVDGMDEDVNTANAEELIKLGLKNDMKSNVCWHVYGLFHRSCKNYPAAIKSYKTALRLQGGDLQILRDLASLQAQTRDYAGYLATRGEVLQLRPTSASAWMSFIVAQHLNKSYDTALQAISSYRKTLQEEKKKEFDYSELCYLESEIFIAKGDLEGALGQLDEHKAHMRDQVRFRERKAWLLMSLRRFEEASAVYISLFKLNPENYNYHRGYQCCLLQSADHWHTDGGLDLPIYHSPALTEEQRSTLHAAYVFLRRHQPRCTAHKTMLLCLAPEAEFRGQVATYVRSGISKAKPCEFEIYRSLAQSRNGIDTYEIIANILEETRSFLEAGKDLSGAELADGDAPPPTHLLFTLLFLAQVRDAQGRHPEALELLETGLQHTPTFVELYMAKAKVLKHAGDLRGAVSVLDYGRQLDLADRFINSRTTKYLLRANRCQQADDTINLFVKNDKEYSMTLFELQCLWYEVAAGRAHLRRGDLPAALQKFMSTNVHFKDIVEDQFDFHSYCFRQGHCNLQAYLEMLQHVDELRAHRFFVAGGLGLIACYLEVHRRRKAGVPVLPAAMIEEAKSQAVEQAAVAAAEESPAGPDTSNMSSKELKALKRRQKQAAKKKAKKAANDAEDDAASGGSKGKGAGDNEDDQQKKRNQRTGAAEPDGKELAEVEDPLAEAAKWVQILVDAHKAATGASLHSTVTPRARVDVCLAQVEVALEQNDLALALKGLVGAQSVVADATAGAPELEARVLVWRVRVVSALASAASKPPEVQALLQDAIVPESLDAKALATDFLSSRASPSSGAAYCLAIAGAKALLELDPASSSAGSAITSADEFTGVTAQLASEGYFLLANVSTQSEAAAKQKAFIDKSFPLCKLHTEPLKPDEQDEQAVGPEPIEPAPAAFGAK